MMMRKGIKTTAVWLGIAAGIAGIEHGYYEILQGNSRPDSIMIYSMGPPCVPHEIWNACEPAMTIVPNYLVTGILAMAIGTLILVWSLVGIQRKNGGAVLIFLSLALLLFGGGLFPPLIGIIGGITGTKINKPLSGKQPNSLIMIAAKLWPWALGFFILWVFGQFLVGFFFNEFLQKNMVVGVILILVLLPLSVYCAYAHDFLTAMSGD
jgi:hypothetical protein